MNDRFLIHFYETITKPSGCFVPSPNNPIEIKDIKNEDTVIKAIKDLFSSMDIINAVKMVNNVEKVSFNIGDSNENIFWIGEGAINGNQIDIIKIEKQEQNAAG